MAILILEQIVSFQLESPVSRFFFIKSTTNDILLQFLVRETCLRAFLGIPATSLIIL